MIPTQTWAPCPSAPPREREGRARKLSWKGAYRKYCWTPVHRWGKGGLPQGTGCPGPQVLSEVWVAERRGLLGRGQGWAWAGLEGVGSSEALLPPTPPHPPCYAPAGILCRPAGQIRGVPGGLGLEEPRQAPDATGSDLEGAHSSLSRDSRPSAVAGSGSRSVHRGSGRGILASTSLVNNIVATHLTDG